MESIKSVTILGKSQSGAICPFDTEEVWGVNNVASHPEHRGALQSIRLVDGGQGYAHPPAVSFVGDGKGATAVAEIADTKVSVVKVAELGEGYTSPPIVVFTDGNGTGAKCEVTIFPKRKFAKLFAFDEALEKQYTDGMKAYAPIMSWQPFADIQYPLQAVIDEFKTKYFTNTVSYMLAYAAYLRVPLIKVYGVDTSFGAPYAQENRGVEYWIGRCHERGCTVEVAPESQLLRTISGALYGERDHCNANLQVHERIALINCLPRDGSYSDCLKAQNAWWVLMPKEDEAKAHGLVVQRLPDGNLNFQCPQEFISDVHMPPETWDFLRRILRDMEAAHKLPFACLSAYEKLILSKPFDHN